MIALPNGDLCVADRLYSRLQVLSRDGEQKHTIGNYGRSTGQVVSCKGMACDGDSIYVSDYAKSRVQKLRLHDGGIKFRIVRHDYLGVLEHMHQFLDALTESDPHRERRMVFEMQFIRL